MRNLPKSRVLIRWMFDALGFLLIFGHDFVVHYVLCADFWGGLLFGEGSAGYAFLMAAAYLYLIPTALLCWITAAGLKRNSRWSHPVGIFTCILLLLAFPFLMFAGAIGLHVLTPKSSRRDETAAVVPSKPTTDFWNLKRKSKAQPVVLAILWSAAFVLQGWFGAYARRAGMSDWHSGWKWWLWFSVFLLVHSALHESGHAIVAWAAGFKLQIISIGPLTFWRDHSRFQFRFDLGRLFESGGYMGAVPVSDQNLRANEIAVIAAGPITNALTCLVLLAAFFSLPGTAWQNWWWMVSFNAVIAGLLTVGNLIPLGYCDGTMLLHLILWTPAGRLLLDRKRVLQMGQEADALHGEAAFEEEIAVRKAMLERSLAFGPDNAFMIAACHQALGSAYVLVDDYPAAEFHYRKCLAFEAELVANPTLAGNVWSGIQLTSIRRQHVVAVGPAFASAIAILEKQRAGAAQITGPAVTFAMLAQAHERNGAFETAIEEIEQGLRTLPRGEGSISLRAHLLRTKAVCRLNLGEVEVGLDAARTAAAIFRSPRIPPARRNLAWEDVADLGHAIWCAGQSVLAIELMREGISHLESGGAPAASQYRIKLAAALRQIGFPDDARAALPAEPHSPAVRRAFVHERAQLYLTAGHPDQAMNDCRELVALWRAHSCSPAPEIASAEALLAQACLAAGKIDEAESLARGAADLLGAWQHPDAASCLVTLALAHMQATGEVDSDRIAEAFHRIENAPLLGPAEKARRKDAETARIRRSPVAMAVGT
jgi:tetratricopeptide (TPR) repeat protein/Zn-dependent protease